MTATIIVEYRCRRCDTRTCRVYDGPTQNAATALEVYLASGEIPLCGLSRLLHRHTCPDGGHGVSELIGAREEKT